MKASRPVLVVWVLLLALVPCGCRRLKARDQLNKGVNAYRNAQFQSAIMHFKQAVDLDPELLNARLYLATAYAQQYIPGGDSPDNVKVGDQAIDTFQQVLQRDPNNATAIAGIAQIYYNMKKFEKAKEYQRRRLTVEANNPEPYYWIGVINWAVCYQRDGQLRKDLKLDVPDAKGELRPLPEKDRAQLAEQNSALVDEGIKALKKALDIKPNDFDAMAYLNLMFRQKADIDATPVERAFDIKQAEDWVQKALTVKKQAAARATVGITP